MSLVVGLNYERDVMAAKKSSLETLHEMLTELFMEDIKIYRSEGVPMSASDKAVIVKFPKDNDEFIPPTVKRFSSAERGWVSWKTV